MFIGEAPGRLGADQTEIPFHGDVSGHNFEEFLSFAGIHREDIFVTNAVLCNPKDNKGNNATPLQSESENCARHLRRQIELVNPQIVVSLGGVALRALNAVSSHQLELATHVRTSNEWFGRELIPLYHPGQRALIHRSKANQRSDYQFVAERMRRSGTVARKTYGITPAQLLQISEYFLYLKHELSYFELHKFAYLMEYLYARQTGRRLSAAHFIRQKDGPYCIELQIDRLRRADPSLRLRKREGRLLLTKVQGVFSTNELPKEILQLAEEVVTRYSYTDEADLKRAVYLTAPMRFIMRREKIEKINLYNSAIDFLTA